MKKARLPKGVRYNFESLMTRFLKSLDVKVEVLRL